MDLRALPPELLVAAAIAAGVLALVQTLRLTWIAFVRRRRLRVAREQGAAGELRAEALLVRLGYAILGCQVSTRYDVRIDGEPVSIELRADYLVAWRDRRFVAEVKTGRWAPRIDTSATRRQLLEYRIAFDVEGVLLVDAESERVHVVEFPLPGAAPAAAPLGRLAWWIAGLAIGIVAATAFHQAWRSPPPLYSRAMRLASLGCLAALLPACGTTPSAAPDASTVTASASVSAAPGASAPTRPASIVTTPPGPAPSASADAVTQASTHAYDDAPSVIASGSVDGAALRKRHIERLKADTSPVTVLRGGGPLELGQRICEAVVPKRPTETPVLLKPNLCGFDGVKDPAKHGGDDGVLGRTTDVEFTRGVIHCLKARGHTRITIAEGCGISHQFWTDVTRITGYDRMSAEEGVPLVAMDDDGVFDVEGEQPGKPLAVRGIGATRVPTLLLPKVLAEHLDHGLFLSLPKMKEHRYAVVSLGIKGMQGTVMLSDKSPAYKQKWRMHKELGEYIDQRKQKLPEDRALYVATLRAFAERMVDTLEISAPDAVLADGSPAMAGDGFQALRPSAENVAIGGTNPVLVDKVGSAFFGVYKNASLASELGGNGTSPLITIAAKRYKLDLDATVVVGDGADLARGPRPVHYKAMAPFAIDFDPPGVHIPATPDWSALHHAAVAVSANDAAAKAPTPTPGGKPEAHAASLGADRITLDGKGDDPAWARAPKIAWNTDYAGNATAIGTTVRLLWDKGGLYALFELANAGLHTDMSKPVTEERRGLYNEDCVELFFTPDPANPKHYYEIEIGPLGHYFDIDVDRARGKEDTGWSSGARIAASRNPAARTATIELLLGAPEISAALAPGARLPLGLYRFEGTSERTYLAWSPPRTPKPNFHVPDAFGVLVLDP